MANDKKEKAAAETKEPRKLVAGDRVLVPAIVTNVLQGDMCMIALETEMPGNGITTITLHACQLVADEVNIGGDGGDKNPH